MKYTCSLCGGKLKDGVCTECGMDNRKSDEMYRNCLNRSKYDHTSMGTMSHVHTEEGAENYKQPVLNENRNKSTGKSKGENPRKRGVLKNFSIPLKKNMGMHGKIPDRILTLFRILW